MGKHYIGCVIDYPECPCVTCDRDGGDDHDTELCCNRHNIHCGDSEKCNDWLKEQKQCRI